MRYRPRAHLALTCLLPPMSARSFCPRLVLSLAWLGLAACGRGEGRISGSLEADSGPRRLPQVEPREYSSRPRLAEHPVSRLELERSLGGTASFAWVTAILPFGRFLVVADPNIPPAIKIVDPESGEVIHAIGPRGEGPGELMEPHFLARLAQKPGELQVFDFHDRRISRYNLSEDGRRAELEGTLTLNINATILEATPLPDRTGYLANGLFGDFGLLVLDSAGHEVRRLSTDPPFTEADFGARRPLRQANLKWMAADPDGERFALAYQNTARIDLLESPAGPLRTALGPREPEKKVDIVRGDYIELEGDEDAYVNVYATRARVYGLYCGCPSGDDAEDLWEHGPYQVHVFEWDGDYLGELELDHGITRFAVSYDDSWLWGVYEDLIPYIGEWALPGWVRRK